MNPTSSAWTGTHEATERLWQTVRSLPARYRRMLEPLCEQIDHWAHLRDQAILAADDVTTDLRLENAYLRFDLEVTRRERDELKHE